MKGITKHAIYIGLAVVFLSACASDPYSHAWIAPADSISYDAKAVNESTIPIYRLGEDVEFPYEPVGHIIISDLHGWTADTLPLNYKSELPAKAKERIRGVASKLGADAVISVTQSGFFGWSNAGQYIDGFAVKFVDEFNSSNISSDRPDYITCLLPLVSSKETDEEANKIDQEIRIKATHFLKFKGYYVLTPPRTDFLEGMPSFPSLDEDELDNLCNHKVDLFIVLNLNTVQATNSKTGFDYELENLTITVFSVKEKRNIIVGSKIIPSGSLITSGIISAGLIGGAISAMFDSSAASEDMVKGAIDPLPDIIILENTLLNN